MSDPVVSVVMAVHDGAPTVKTAVDSILAQEGPALELIVVDDGSTDGTRAVLADIRDSRLTVVVNGHNLGLTASLNRGLAVAKGGLIARMDADDVALAGRLAVQAEALARARADVCFCRAVIVDQASVGERPWPARDWTLVRWRGLYENAYGPHPAAMFRHSAVAALGGYDEAFRRAQDYDLWDRCVAAGLRFAYVGQVLLRYRDHRRSVTRAHADEQADAARRVSLRALARVFPAADGDEIEALRWLMTGQGPRPVPGGVNAALAGSIDRARWFLETAGGGAGRTVWKDVADRLARRLGDVSGPTRRLAARRMWQAALRAASPGAAARALVARMAARA